MTAGLLDRLATGPVICAEGGAALEREAPASRHSPDTSRHAFLGTDAALKAHNQAYAPER